jgi:hypothetical protein
MTVASSFIVLMVAFVLIGGRYLVIRPVVENLPRLPTVILLGLVGVLVLLGLRDVGTSASGIVGAIDLVLFVSCIGYLVLRPRQ